ncbi:MULTISPECIES: phage tail protein [unclassified Massilia]|uniref:phage tail protein n=1 Tax=unclassified Massilia TaxID=2609279 RepID=UPI0017853064|nr:MULTISPECIES: phage tail protein [unclassified Massilia]MBD8531579.1 phage tail protein [Massilia sp. CFBP 13647]MBD8673625.1 phage tail protein [Massilia sp. CFBP 13721]
MTTTFTWKHDARPSGTSAFRVLKAQFGDGYQQTAADGINNKSQSWPLSFTGAASKIAPITAFLDTCGGWQSFYWTPPLGAQGFYKCASYDSKHLGGDMWQLTATFEQSFQP